MNQDPNNPIAPTPNAPAPEAPVAPATPDFSNPAAAAAPVMDMGAAPAPEVPAAPEATVAPEAPAAPEAAPAMPEAPSIDPSLLQQAINDIPDETAATAPEVPSTVPLDNLGAEEAPAPEVNPLTTAAPAADFSTPEAPTAPADPNAAPTNDAQKTTPSVAFNDPASQPDAPKHGKDIDFSKLSDKIKQHPMPFIIGGGFIIIVGLVLILAFAV